MSKYSDFNSKGRTIIRVMGGGGGEFSACTNFFCSLLVQEFFFQVKPSARIFFFGQILLFSQLNFYFALK